HLVSQRVQIILPHVPASHLHNALCGVVQSGDQLDQGRLGRSRTADDTDRLAGLNVKVYIRQSHLVSFFRIFKAYAVKINGTVFHFIHRVFRIAEGAFFIQHFHDSPCRLAGHGNHNKHHGKHHQAAEDLEIIGEKRGKLSHIQIKPFRGDNGVGSEVKHKDHNRIQAELHQGVVKGQDLLRLCEVHAYI